MLKKQTVWLLTMLSLMIVLSVYYLNSPSEGDLAYIDSQDEKDQTTSSQTIEQSEEEPANESEELVDAENVENMETSSLNTDEYFASVRMEIANQRSMEKERLGTIAASSESSSDEINEAYEAMKEIDKLNEKENILEDTIKSLNGYDQVLVRNISDNNVVVTVQTDSLSAKEANEIIQQAKDEFGEIDIEVVYQAS